MAARHYYLPSGIVGNTQKGESRNDYKSLFLEWRDYNKDWLDILLLLSSMD